MGLEPLIYAMLVQYSNHQNCWLLTLCVRNKPVEDVLNLSPAVEIYEFS